jgi:hypothetical protein
MGIIIDCTTGETRDETAEEAAATAVTADQMWANIRARRNTMLAECDWTQLPDAPVDSAAWATYRQALRDITTQPDAFAVTWPAAPIGA